MYILLFILVLFVLVLVHELGHFIVAKKTGMRVDEFGIGFPPRLFGIKRGETLYSINSVPLGGFVKIYGEDGDDEETNPDSSRAFGRRPIYAQAAVLVAGVLMNVLFAWLLFSLSFAIGTKSAVSEEEAGPGAELTVLSVLTGSPAEEAGIRPGMMISFVANGEGHPVDKLTPGAVSAFIAEYDSIIIHTQSKGETKVRTLVPRGDIIPDAPERKVVGVSMGLVEMERRSVPAAFWSGAVYTYESTIAVAQGIWQLASRALLLRADLSQVAGPVGMAGLVGDAASFGFTSLLMFTAFISLNLAVINILPFPALDGGRLLFVVIESIKGSPIPGRIAYSANATGFILLILLMVAVTYNDIIRVLH